LFKQGKMKAIVLLVVLAAALARPEWETHYQWEKFRAMHKKLYASAEEAMHRFTVFRENMDLIDSENSKGLSYTLGVNQFADMTNEEYRQILSPMQRSRSLRVASMPKTDIPNDIDWTTKGAVTPVKNQQQCGSCWAFSTTGAVEGLYFLQHGQLVSFSEQELVDCATAEGNHGCEGGWMDYGFQYIIDNGGICTESGYPYEARDNTCRKSKCTKVANIVSAYQDVAEGSEADLATAVSQQTVSVAIEADQSGFQFYRSGVFTGTCGTNLDHGVLLVGYGHDAASGKDFWKVKNSWGTSWGEQGYIRLQKGKAQSGGQCGIALAASYPTN
jgi:C1A family cysteine protease